MRLTKDVISKILNQNNGFEKETSYSSRNLSVSNRYKIKDGKLYRRETGKTSWSDSRFDNSDECDIEQTRNFIKKFIDKLNLEGIE